MTRMLFAWWIICFAVFKTHIDILSGGEDALIHKIRWTDNLPNELAREKPMEKVLR